MTGRRALLGAYGLGVTVPAAAVIVLLIMLGRTTPSPTGPGPHHPVPDAAPDPMPSVPTFDIDHVLLVTAVVVTVAHLGGVLAARVRQPQVVGQVAAGVLLGPSTLGRICPTAERWLHSDGAAAAMDLLAQLGIILFAFLIGRELSGSFARSVWAAALLIGQTMVAVPLLAGVTLGLWLLPAAPTGIPSASHALFLGLAMSATALPVLAHVLKERGMISSRLGLAGTAAAAVGDVTVWCLLALTTTMVHQGPGGATALRVCAVLGLAAGLVFLACPLARRANRHTRESRYVTPGLLLCALLVSAAVADLLGLNPIFGGLLVGATLTKGSRPARHVTAMAEGATEWLLLPVFFTGVGRNTHLDVLGDWPTIGLCLVILLVATTSKIASAAAAGKVSGFTGRDAMALGIMMNCRGLTELVLLNAGLTAGIIDARTFTIFMVMALATTASTGPLLDLLGVRQPEPRLRDTEPPSGLPPSSAGTEPSPVGTTPLSAGYLTPAAGAAVRAE